MIQGGDPTGSGQGGPGYTTTDKPPADTVYERGMVAMAKTGAEPPGTAGSQFFVVTGQAPDLAPEYATLGTGVEGPDGRRAHRPARRPLQRRHRHPDGAGGHPRDEGLGLLRV